MSPNADLKKNLCTQLYLAVPESNSDDSDDSDVDIDIPEHLPLIQVWLDVGPFQVLLAHLPEVYENHFIAELTAWLRGVEMEPVQEPPGVRNEVELARDFYSRGLLLMIFFLFSMIDFDEKISSPKYLSQTENSSCRHKDKSK